MKIKIQIFRKCQELLGYFVYFKCLRQVVISALYHVFFFCFFYYSRPNPVFPKTMKKLIEFSPQITLKLEMRHLTNIIPREKI